MNRILYPAGYCSDGKRMLGTFESGDIFRLASWAPRDPDDPDEPDAIFGMAVDVDGFESSVLVLDMLEGRILELSGMIYAQPCPDAVLLAKMDNVGRGKIKIVDRDISHRKLPRLIDVPVGGIFAESDFRSVSDKNSIPALCMRTETQRYKDDDLLITCVDLLEGTTFEKDAYKNAVIEYENASLCPYGYVKDRMAVGGTKDEKPAR